MIDYLFCQTFKNQKGTSLLEVLVSICIVLLVFQLTYMVVLSSRQIVNSRNNITASAFAVSLMEAMRTEEIETGCYQVNDSLLGISSPEGMEAEILVSDVENRSFLKVVKITVEWMGENQAHQLEMHSLLRKDL